MRTWKVVLVALAMVGLSAGTVFAEDGWPATAPSPAQVKPSSYALAREILRNDFITPEEVVTARGLSYTKDQLKRFANTLPSEDALRWCQANNYALVAGPPKPMGSVKIRSLKPANFYSKTDSWYEGQAFSKDDTAKPEWLAIRKEPVPHSVNKTWPDQLSLLSKDERVPNAGELTWFITTFYEVRATRLFEHSYVITVSVTDSSRVVVVGGFGSDGLHVGSCWVCLCGRLADLGLSSARKVD